MSEIQAQTQEKPRFGLSNNILKIIAMLSMFIDHLGVQIYPQIGALRIIGRLALPLFAYMIAEGCFYTKNRARYLILISSLAVACQVVFYIAENSLYQGILVTFSLSIITIYSIDTLFESKDWKKILLAVLGIIFVIFVSFVMPKLFENEGFEIDYGVIGMLLPVAIYFMSNKILKLVACAFMLVLLALEIGLPQHYAVFALPLLALYNGKRGTKKLKYVFYAFYPLHLILIYLLSFIL
jgi:hypothetical protein